MKGIMNFLAYLNSNWTTILAIVALLFALYMKIKSAIDNWLKMTDKERQRETEEQIKKAKQAIANYILSLVAQAEVDWADHGLGQIKRAQVIEKIYKEYPILLEVVDQRELMQFIDDHIDNALEIVREKLRKEANLEVESEVLS
jgi:hypothetical protein